MRATAIYALLTLLLSMPLFADPPGYRGVTLGMNRSEAMEQVNSEFPDAEAPSIFEDKKVTMVILKNPDAEHQEITLHFHPNGKLFGINVTVPVGKEEMLKTLSSQLGARDRESKRGHSWDLGRYRVITTVFVKGEITLKNTQIGRLTTCMVVHGRIVMPASSHSGQQSAQRFAQDRSGALPGRIILI